MAWVDQSPKITQIYELYINIHNRYVSNMYLFAMLVAKCVPRDEMVINA